MNEQEALSKMYSPGVRRPGKRAPGGVIQIHVTRACDQSCFNCTQGSNLRGKSVVMTPDQFEQACISLSDYFGTVGVFGGNPATSPHFEEYCRIMQKHIPFQRRGLWCNNPLGKGKIMAQTFNPRVSNLNCHLDSKAYKEFKRDWPKSLPFGHTTDSRHSPVFVSMQDVVDDEEKRWELISNCDINQHWSAMIGVFRGELRAWFCEIAGAQSILKQNDPDYPDTGFPVNKGWWRLGMQDFAEQVRWHCHRCGVPLRGYGELAQASEGVEQCSKEYEDIYQPKKKGREVEVVTTLEQLNSKALKFTQYLQGSKK